MLNMPAYKWVKDGAGFRADIGNITLGAHPDRTKGILGDKPARGTKWRASVSQWDGKSTISRYGRDCYSTLCANAKEARQLADSVYAEALVQETP